MQESVKFVAELNNSPVLKALASYFGRATDSLEMPGPRSLPAETVSEILKESFKYTDEISFRNQYEGRF